MASVYLHSRGKSPYYVGVFRGADGRQHHRSTKQTRRDKALALCEKWERQAKQLRASSLRNKEMVAEAFIAATQRAATGDFSESVARGVLNQILDAAGHSPMQGDSVRDFLLAWATSKETTKASGTGKRYRHTVEEFITHLGTKADHPLSSVLPRDIEAFRDLQVKLGKSACTANLEVKTLRIPFNQARRQGLILSNPGEAVELLDAGARTRRPFTQEEVQRLLKAADEEWRGLILVGLCTGLRLGDASGLRWSDIDLGRGTLTVQPQKRKRGTTPRVLENILLPDLRDHLTSLQRPTDAAAPVFPKLSQAKISGNHGLSYRFQALMEQAGVRGATHAREKPGKGRNFKELTFHSLRHSYVSWMANQGVPKEVRKKLAGHTSDVHDRYTHLELDRLRMELSSFPRLELPMKKPSAKKSGRT